MSMSKRQILKCFNQWRKILKWLLILANLEVSVICSLWWNVYISLKKRYFCKCRFWTPRKGKIRSETLDWRPNNFCFLLMSYWPYYLWCIAWKACNLYQKGPSYMHFDAKKGISKNVVFEFPETAKKNS